MSRFERILPEDKKYLVKVSTDDGEAEVLNEKIVAGTYITKTIDTSSGVETITLDVDITEVNSAVGTANDKVKVNASTSTSGYLADKIKASGAITLDVAPDNSELIIKWSAALSDLSNAIISASTERNILIYDSEGNVRNDWYNIFSGTVLDTSAGTDSIEVVTRDKILNYFREGEVSDISGGGIFYDATFVNGSEGTLRLATSAVATLSDTADGKYWCWSGIVTYNDTSKGVYRTKNNGVFLETTHNSSTGTYVGTSVELGSLVPESWDSTTDPRVDLFLTRPPTGDKNKYAIRTTLSSLDESDTAGTVLTAAFSLTADATEQNNIVRKTLLIGDTACAHLDLCNLSIAMSSTANTTESITDNTGKIYGARFRFRTKSMNLKYDDVSDV
jgi:hypothetical protein